MNYIVYTTYEDLEQTLRDHARFFQADGVKEALVIWGCGMSNSVFSIVQQNFTKLLDAVNGLDKEFVTKIVMRCRKERTTMRTFILIPKARILSVVGCLNELIQKLNETNGNGGIKLLRRVNGSYTEFEEFGAIYQLDKYTSEDIEDFVSGHYVRFTESPFDAMQRSLLLRVDPASIEIPTYYVSTTNQ